MSNSQQIDRKKFDANLMELGIELAEMPLNEPNGESVHGSNEGISLLELAWRGEYERVFALIKETDDQNLCRASTLMALVIAIEKCNWNAFNRRVNSVPWLTIERFNLMGRFIGFPSFNYSGTAIGDCTPIHFFKKFCSKDLPFPGMEKYWGNPYAMVDARRLIASQLVAYEVDIDLGVHLAKANLDLFPGSSADLSTYISALVKQGRYKEAVNLILDFRKKYPARKWPAADYTLRFEMSEALVSQGRKGKARLPRLPLLRILIPNVGIYDYYKICNLVNVIKMPFSIDVSMLMLDNSWMLLE